MHRLTDPKPGRKAPIGPLLLLALAVAAVGLSMASEALAVDRWKRPRAGAEQFRTLRMGPNAFRPNAFGPNAVGSVGANSRADAVAGPEQRREGVGNIPAEGRPAELNRLILNSAERGPAELQRPGANPVARAPADLQRQAPGSLAPNTAQRGPLQNGQAGSFARRALAERTLQGPGRFGHGAFAGRFQPRPFAGGPIVRRPMIGERGFTGVPPAGETRFLTNEMVFHVPANVSPQTVDTVARRLGLSTVASQSFNLSGGTLFHFRINDGRPVADVVRALESENIGVAQPNYVFRLQQDATLAARSSGGDPSQYVVDKLRLVDVHRIAIGSNVLVAVIDSQIDGKHPELAGAVVDEFDAIGNHDKPHVHGTGMAGAIAAHRRLIGIAPGVRLLAIHAFSSNGTDSAEATSAHILMGIDWAIRKGAKIINMSFAGPDDPMLQLALQKAHDKGVILIAAAGNMGPKSPPLYPAADPNVIAVTATDAKDQLLAQANQGAYVAVAAPGVDILEPAPNRGYQVTTGTSVAAAHVSGIVALLLDHDPTLDATAIRDILTSSAKHHAPKGRDDQFGWGLVDPYRALMEADTKVAKDRSKVPATTEGAAAPRPISAR
jgi:subtilisin family serine protease